MAIAFFDLDKTLLSTNSGALWVRRELRLGHISWWQAMRAGFWMLCYQLGIATLGDALLRAISHLRGVPVADVRDRTREFYEAEVRSLYRTGAQRAMQEHRARGDKLVLLTATSMYLAELVALELSFDAVLCNRFEVDETGSVHTGRPEGVLCFGVGKLDHATACAREAGVPLSECTFYTDSFSDLPVLVAVGKPVAVNPDRRLRREALRRGWEIVEWGAPEPLPTPTEPGPARRLTG